jgi:septum formation protein
MNLVLASGSPRRRELLALAGLAFEVCPPKVLEAVDPALSPSELARALAAQKARAVALARPGACVLGADTLVALNGQILGKPPDEARAAATLRLLSGKTHSVHTGVCLLWGGQTRCFSQETRVTFYPLTEEEIAAYVATGEPMDKAGAYGIQGRGGLLVKKIAGDYWNVVGLPLAAVARALRAL